MAMLSEDPRADAVERDDREVLVIEPRRGRGLGVVLDKSFFAELLKFRELLYFLVWRDVKVRYKMAALGIAWAVMVPLVSTLIYGMFGSAVGFGEDVKVPWLLIVAAGMTPWSFIQKSISDGGLSLVYNQHLLSKIYMPRIFIPVASCGTAMVDTLVALLVALGFGVFFWARGDYTPTLDLLAIPLLIPLTFIAGAGSAILLSGLTVLYRDIRFLIPFLTQFGLWLSAVVVPIDKVLGEHVWIAAFNPYAGIVSAWQSAICGMPWRWELIAGSLILCPIIFVVGIAYFRGVERRFADIA